VSSLPGRRTIGRCAMGDSRAGIPFRYVSGHPASYHLWDGE